MMQLAGPNDGGWGYTKQDAGIQNGNTGWRFKILNEDTAGSKGGSVRRINDSDLSPASRVGCVNSQHCGFPYPLRGFRFQYCCSFSAVLSPRTSQPPLRATLARMPNSYRYTKKRLPTCKNGACKYGPMVLKAKTPQHGQWLSML